MAVDKDPTKHQDEWLINPNPASFETSFSSAEECIEAKTCPASLGVEGATIGNERNPQRQMDFTGSLEQELVGKALGAAGVEFDNWIASPFDRNVNGGRLTRWASSQNGEKENVEVTWDLCARYGKHAQVSNSAIVLCMISAIACLHF